MSIKVLSGASTDELTIDATSKAARVTLYDSSGTELSSTNPLYTLSGTGRGTFIGEYMVTSFRTAGLASNPHNLFTIWNPALSGKNIALKRLTIQLDHTTLLATNLHLITSHPTAQPTGGTALTYTKFDTNYDASIAEVKGATASDGGVATAITATAGTRVWSQFGQRPHTLVGWFTMDDLDLIPYFCLEHPIILEPGDGILVNTVSNATTGAHYVTNCLWEEYTP